MKFKVMLKVESKTYGTDPVRLYEKDVEINCENLDNGMAFLFGEVSESMINDAWFNDRLNEERNGTEGV